MRTRKKKTETQNLKIKTQNLKISDHFWLSEFACKLCKRISRKEALEHAKKFLPNLIKLCEVLEQIRAELGKPIVINSGIRCRMHNSIVGGKKNSAHLVGLACDIKCSNSKDRFKILKKALEIGVKRIGVGKNFVHIDIDETKPQEVVWTYY